jgi:DNA cross-link repair 1A protein
MQGACAAPAGGVPQSTSGRGRGRGGGGGGRGRGAAGGKGGRGWTGPKSLAPFKRIEGSRYVVDGFTCGAMPGDVHFLTHFHSDHYIGLTKRWPAPVYASAVTAALVSRRLGLPPTQLVVLPLNAPTEVPGGARVTPIDANHCPGAVLLLFQVRDRSIHLGS